MIEVWKDVVGWEEFYQISNFGRVKVKQRIMHYDKNVGRGVEKKTVNEKIRKQKFNKHTGYMMVGLNGKGKSKNMTVHSMVAKAFIKKYKAEGIGKGLCTNHKDGDKLNNNLENLEVVTVKENIRHMFETGLSTTNIKVRYEGVVYYSKAKLMRETKLSERKVKKMISAGTIEVV